MAWHNATIKYVLNNPVKAGLVKDWREWRWNYCRKELSDKLKFVGHLRNMLAKTEFYEAGTIPWLKSGEI